MSPDRAARAAQASELERRAHAAFNALRANDAHAADRVELRDAGVATDIIESLYFYEFFDLSPIIKTAITSASFTGPNAMVEDHHWNSLTEAIRWHVGRFSPQIQDGMQSSISASIKRHREAYDELHAHIVAALPERPSINRNLGANTSLYALMNTCWLMNRATSTTRALNWRIVHEDFLQTLSRTMPNFLAQHAPAAKIKA